MNIFYGVICLYSLWFGVSMLRRVGQPVYIFGRVYSMSISHSLVDS